MRRYTTPQSTQNICLNPIHKHYGQFTNGDMGRKIRIVEIPLPQAVPQFAPVRREVEVRKLVPVRRKDS